MNLVDAGPLIAILDVDDPDHSLCIAAMHRLPKSPLLTTWPAFTEAMYLLGSRCGYRAQEELWRYVADGLLVVHANPPPEVQRMRMLMATYRDTPMDLADASLVAAAENLAMRRIFTLESHFYAYRTERGDAFEIVP